MCGRWRVIAFAGSATSAPGTGRGRRRRRALRRASGRCARPWAFGLSPCVRVGVRARRSPLAAGRRAGRERLWARVAVLPCAAGGGWRSLACASDAPCGRSHCVPTGRLVVAVGSRVLRFPVVASGFRVLPALRRRRLRPALVCVLSSVSRPGLCWCVWCRETTNWHPCRRSPEVSSFSRTAARRRRKPSSSRRRRASRCVTPPSCALPSLAVQRRLRRQSHFIQLTQ